MSHLACPLCGKYAPLTSFDPENLDLDLCLVSFIGLGRGRGFTTSDKISILGDETYSPMIADRIVDLLKMFLNEGVISREQILERLELKEVILQTGEYVSAEQYKTSILLNEYYQKKLASIELNMNREIDSLTLDLKKKNKELEELRMVEKILFLMIKNFDTEMVEGKGVPWILIINEIEDEDILLLLDLSKILNDDIRKLLKLRIKGRDLTTQTLLEQFLLKKRRYLAESILEP